MDHHANSLTFTGNEELNKYFSPGTCSFYDYFTNSIGTYWIIKLEHKTLRISSSTFGFYVKWNELINSFGSRLIYKSNKLHDYATNWWALVILRCSYHLYYLLNFSGSSILSTFAFLYRTHRVMRQGCNHNQTVNTQKSTLYALRCPCIFNTHLSLFHAIYPFQYLCLLENYTANAKWCSVPLLPTTRTLSILHWHILSVPQQRRPIGRQIATFHLIQSQIYYGKEGMLNNLLAQWTIPKLI